MCVFVCVIVLICNSYFNVNVKKHTNYIFKVSSAFFCVNNECKRENGVVKRGKKQQGEECRDGKVKLRQQYEKKIPKKVDENLQGVREQKRQKKNNVI